MSEDRLEQALHGMKHEAVDAATLEAARVRAWDTVRHATLAPCAEFRADFRAYVSGALAGSRRVLLEDHLSRCPACRNALAEVRGQAHVIAMPHRQVSRWRRWGALAAAAALVIAVTYAGRDRIDDWMAPGGPRATIVSATGGVYGLPGGPLDAGAAIGEKERIRTGPGAHAVLRLADGSTVDVNERTELFVTAAWSGQAIHLQRGDVIVQAAKQRRGGLRVLTRDSIATVKGTVFAVSAGMSGSVVSVVEGAVWVNQPGRKLVLSPGEQAASNPALATSVADAVAWSPDAEQYLQLLASFAKIERQLAGVPGPVRTTSALLSYIPSGTFVYGSLPNPGGKIGLGLTAAEQQATENAAFRAWWTSDTGLQLRRIVDGVQSVSSLLGEEVVFFVASAGAQDEVPIVVSRVQAQNRATLVTALEKLFAEAGDAAPPYSVSDDLMVISDAPAHLAWALDHLGGASTSPFAAAIADRYRRGVGWLVGVDAAPAIKMASNDDAPPVEFADMMGVKYLFLEQRSPGGVEENAVTAMFEGARSGMASWLADGGSGGAAEYLPADALVAGYASTREPGQLFQEFTALVSSRDEAFTDHLAALEEKLGAGFVANLVAAMGTEAAFAFSGFSVNGPTWVVAALTNDPAAVDHAVATLVNTANAELQAEDPLKRLVLAQESAGGRVWTTVRAEGLPFGVTWTYEGGYLVAASDRATAERAIATRSAGTALIWSPAFQGQLPASAGIHPSAFAWLNAKGALGVFSAASSRTALTDLLNERDPVLVVFDGSADQIQAASRTRLSGVIMDAMLLESASRAFTGPQPAADVSADSRQPIADSR